MTTPEKPEAARRFDSSVHAPDLPSCGLHHVDINVSDLARSAGFYGRVLERLGFEPFESGTGWVSYRNGRFCLTVVQTEARFLAFGFHRKRIGVNHLAFPAPARRAVDELHAWLVQNQVPILYGGPLEMGTAESPNYAVFFEDPDRLKLEYVYRPAWV